MLSKEMFNKLLLFEGEYSNHPADKGGETIYGVTEKFDKKAFDKIVKLWRDGNKELAKEEALKVYNKNYYLKAKCDLLESVNMMDSIVHQLFDMAVNMGVKTSIKILQKAMNVYNKRESVMVDGVLGNETLSELRIMNNKEFNNILVDQRIVRYKEIVSANSSQSVFLKGWTNRAESFRIKG